MLRMEIALFLVLTLVASVYFSAGKKPGNQHRAFSAGIGDMKSFLKDAWNVIHVFYQIAVFYKGFYRTGNISFLEYIASQQF